MRVRQSAPSNLTSAAELLCFIVARAGVLGGDSRNTQGTHRRQGDGRRAWPQGLPDASIWLDVSRRRRPWAPRQGFPRMSKSALCPRELPESGPGRERTAGRQGLLDTALPGSGLLRTKMPIRPNVYLIISGNLQCLQDCGWHGSSWGGQSPEWLPAGPAEVTGRTSPGSVSEAQCRVAGAGRRLLGRANSCPHRPAVHGAQGQAVTHHPGLLESASAAQTYRDRPAQRWGPLGPLSNATTLQGPPRSKTGVPEPPMPDLGEPLGSDSGKPFSESYLGGLPGNWALTRSTSPLRAEFQGVTCWAGFVAVLTAKRYQIPNVGSVGDRPIPAPTPPGWVAKLLMGHSEHLCSKAESHLLHLAVRRHIYTTYAYICAQRNKNCTATNIQ